jgi:6-phosphogluconolactonase (cycloisomerase 2 family)
MLALGSWFSVSIKSSVPGFLLLFAVGPLLSCGGSNSAASPSTEILYVLENGSVTTYSVDPTSLEASPVGQTVALISPPELLLQFDPSPDDDFLYAVWSDSQNVQHLSAFKTDDFGVPQLPATQTLDADSLSQFNVHPSGKFAYMLQVTNSSSSEFFARIRLFSIQGADGTLKENPRLQGTYGPAPFWPAVLFGFSPDASKLYISSQTPGGSVYLQRPINTGNGTLAASRQLITLNGTEDVAIGAVIAVLHQNPAVSNEGYLDIFPNIPNPKRAVHCTQAMLSFCGSASSMKLDRSGKYLFLTDPVTSAIHVARINVANHKIVDTGSSLPMTSQTPGFVLNHDGSIVYAMQADGNLHFYHFDSASGSLTEGGTPIPLAQGNGICPAHHPSSQR